MKKLFTLFLFLISLSVLAQVNTQQPKIILQIDSIANRINRLKGEPQKYSVEKEFGTEETYVWLVDNRISKISEVTRYTDGPSDVYMVFEYYFSYNAPVLIRESTNLDKVMNPLLVEKQYDLSSDKFNKYYYDYYEIMQGARLGVVNGDTVFVHNKLLLYATHLFEKYKHLQNYRPYENLKYDKVVAYDFDGTHEGVIVENGKLHPSTKKMQHRELAINQTDSLFAILADTNTFGYVTAACFEPRLGIVFYNSKKIVADINICFECNSMISSVYLPAVVHHRQIDVGEDYVIVIPHTGFSPMGRKQLKQFCHNLGLGLCPLLQDENIFDGVTGEDEE